MKFLFLLNVIAWALYHFHDATYEEAVPILWEMRFQFLYQFITTADLFSPWKQQLQLSGENTTTLGMCNATTDLSDSCMSKQVKKDITSS